jgi:type VI secretion system protein VasG
MGKQEALKRYTVDLTERARSGEIDPVAGRDDEIRQIVDILMRRRQNNPILTGEAGVGKTAVVEGFATRLARGDVPPQLKDVSLLTLDLGLLSAGASMKGEFENRLRSVIDEVQASPKPIILFIDEAHTLIGAGGQAGTGDAANLLKPALARGKLRTIGATTWAEYKKHIEKDPALTRRFQVVQVDEPSEEKAVLMLRGVASILEQHHRVALLDEAITAAVRLSHRYIPARQLPDKAVSLLDTACARVAVSQHATPAELEDCQRRLEALRTESEIIGREEAIGIDVDERRKRTVAAIDQEETRLAMLQKRHEEEKAVVDRILAIRAKLRAPTAAEGAPVAAARETGASKSGASAASSPRTRSPRMKCSAPPIARRSSPSSHRCRPSSTSCRATRRSSCRRSTSRRSRASSRTGPAFRRPHGQERDRVGAQARRHAQPARRRPEARARHDRAAHPDLARPPRQPEQADRRLPALRHVGRRQDRDRARPRRGALRR